MATDVIKMTGNIYWAKVYQPDTAFGATMFKVDFFPENEAEWKKFKDSGIQKTIKENETGKFFSLTRNEMKMIKGEVINFTGPVIEDEDGSVIVDYINRDTQKRIYSYSPKEKDLVVRRGSPILLGNGTKAEVTVAVYDTFKGKGQRLEKIRGVTRNYLLFLLSYPPRHP